LVLEGRVLFTLQEFDLVKITSCIHWIGGRFGRGGAEKTLLPLPDILPVNLNFYPIGGLDLH
jgi:hypothetical protein